MKETPFKNKISPKTKILIALLSIFIIGIIAGQIISNIGIMFLKQTAEGLGLNISDVVEQRVINGYAWLITISCIDIV